MAATSTLSRNGTVILPGAVSWALSLNEGDLVAADQEDAETFRLRFRSYGRRVRSAVETCGQPWGFVEEILRLPLAALGPAGTLGLSSLGRRNPFQCGDPLLVRAEAGQQEPWFTLERATGWRTAQELVVEALYELRVEPGFQVILPEDALWALSLSEGGILDCKTVLNTLEGWNSAKERTLRLEIGPGGALPLPETLREDPRLQPGSALRFEIHLSEQSARFRLAPDLSEF